jgi:hypothetical protein
MARSYRNPHRLGNTKAETEADDKRWANRIYRRRVRQALYRQAEVMPLVREVCDVWGWAKDGRHCWRADPDPRDARK